MHESNRTLRSGRAARHGRGLARAAGTVLLVIYTVVMLLLLGGTHNDPGARFMTIVVWVLGVAATVPLWTQSARAFFATWRRR